MGLWLFCILIFVLSIVVGTNFFRSAVTDTFLGKSGLFGIFFVGSLIVGVLSFIFMLITVAAKELTDGEIITTKRNFVGIIVFIPKLIFVLLFLPIILIYKKITSKKIKLKKKIIEIVLISFLLLPVWVGGYYLSAVVGKVFVQNLLGYDPELENIVGTGSMYPTWPKGGKGKTNDELAAEIVSTANFFKYPNGITLNGKRYFGYTIQHGDIVTARNDAILKSTSEIYSTPSGVLKRVVALGGDIIELKNGVFYLNGEPQKEPYIATPKSTYGENFLKECQVYTVPEDSVFLMGDNRKGSGDSREFGPVKYSEILSVLPLKKQIGLLDKNWHDATNDLIETTTPTIDKDRFITILNEKRVENNAPIVKYEPKLEKSAELRGQNLIAKNKINEETSYNTVVSAMSKADYWNSYVWEWSVEGYYSADELIEDYIERDSTDAKEVWFDKKFDDVGIAEVQGEINECPTQIIVIHAAGYVPPNYSQSDIGSWKETLDNLNGVQAGWADLKNYESFYNQHKSDVDRINEIISIRISRISSIYSTMSSNKWLSSEQQRWMETDTDLYNEQQDLANKLNSSY